MVAGAVGVVDRVLAQVGKRVVGYAEQQETMLVQAHSTVRAAPCPTCRCWSGRLHGCYRRHLAERPILDKYVVLCVEMRRFKCMNAQCARRTFSEDIHALAGRHQRRTRSHARALHALGRALGGEAAARLAVELGLILLCHAFSLVVDWLWRWWTASSSWASAMAISQRRVGIELATCR